MTDGQSEFLRQHDDDQRPLRPGDWVMAIVDCPGSSYYTKGNVGKIKCIDKYGDLWVEWLDGPGAQRMDGVWCIDTGRSVRIDPPTIAFSGEAWKLVVFNKQREQADKVETNARRLLRMVHQWAVCDGRYKGGNLWREVERELS